MRVLRVGTSNDQAAGIPEDARAWKIASDTFAGAVAEPVETVLKRAWPNEGFPGLVSSWMDEYHPDVVVLQVNNFWYGHESVPLWLERRFGRAGKKVANAGIDLSRKSWFADSRLAVVTNRSLIRVLPNATFFSVPQIAARMEDAMRKVLAHEGVVLLVRGNEHWAKLPMATRKANNRNISRNNAMSGAMRAVCDQLHVPYFQRATVEEHEMHNFLNGAQWHNSIEGERLTGEFDGQAMIEAWTATRE
jgi:hypothetical protein